MLDETRYVLINAYIKFDTNLTSRHADKYSRNKLLLLPSRNAVIWLLFKCLFQRTMRSYICLVNSGIEAYQLSDDNTTLTLHVLSLLIFTNHIFHITYISVKKLAFECSFELVSLCSG